MLKTKSEQLDIVVVTASQYEKNIAQQTVSIEVIGPKTTRSITALITSS